jgi:t-SNARE complex subunit (syntaxin)
LNTRIYGARVVCDRVTSSTDARPELASAVGVTTGANQGATPPAKKSPMNKLKVYLPIFIVAVVAIAVVFRVGKLRSVVIGG